MSALFWNRNTSNEFAKIQTSCIIASYYSWNGQAIQCKIACFVLVLYRQLYIYENKTQTTKYLNVCDFCFSFFFYAFTNHHLSLQFVLFHFGFVTIFLVKIIFFFQINILLGAVFGFATWILLNGNDREWA